MLTNKAQAKDTIQDIAKKVVEGQLRTQKVENDNNESTVLILGSEKVGKTTLINKFFEREETPLHTTWALEYAYGRRSGNSSQLSKQVLNIWELGSLRNATDLISVPLKTHRLNNLALVIMLDLSIPEQICPDFQNAYKTIKSSFEKLYDTENPQIKEILKKEHIAEANVETMPCPVVIVGGKYDLFESFDKNVKQHICRYVRAMTHLIGGSVLFYSKNIPKLAKTLRDTINHLGFGSPTNLFRSHITDFNEPLSIWFGTDNWTMINPDYINSINIKEITQDLYNSLQQLNLQDKHQRVALNVNDPAKDSGFREPVIDDMRLLKDEQLHNVVKDIQLREQFETISE